MTIHDQLLAIGADDREMRDAEALLARTVPLGRPILLTDEIVAAARAGDEMLLAALLAEEVQPDEDELVAMRELDEHPELRETTSMEAVRAELGL